MPLKDELKEIEKYLKEYSKQLEATKDSWIKEVVQSLLRRQREILSQMK